MFDNMFLNGNFLKYNTKIWQLGESLSSQGDKKFGNIKDNFNCTKNREASEESHGSSKNTQLILETVPDVPLDLVVGWCVEVDVEDIQLAVVSLANWGRKVIKDYASK